MTERSMTEGELRTLIATALIDEVSALGCETWHFSVIENERFGQDEDTTNAAMLLAGIVLGVLRPHLGQGVTGDGEPYRPVAEMTLWELAQAIAINSDVATNLWVKTAETEEEEEANRAKAMRYFDRRNNCVGEIRDREQAIAGRGEGTAEGT